MAGPPPSPFDLERYIGFGRVDALALRPDGRGLVASVSRPDARTGRFRAALWALRWEDAAPTCLVEAAHHARSPAYAADGSLYFLGERTLAEEGEPRQDQVLRLSAEGPVAVTDAPRGVRAFQVAAAGDRLAWLEDHDPARPEEEQRAAWLREQRHGPGARRFTRQPTRYWTRWLGREAPRLRVATADGQRPRTVAGQGPRDLFEADWRLSDDGRWLALARNRLAPDRLDDAALVLLDLETGQERVLDDSPGVRWSRPCLDPAGTRLAAVRQARRPGQRGRDELWCFDLRDDAAPRHLAPTWDRWPVPVGWAGDELVVEVREDAGQPLYALTPATGALRPLHLGGTVEGCVVRGDTVLALHHDLERPPAPARLELAAPALRRLPALTPADAPPGPACSVQRRRAALPRGGSVPYLVVRPGDAAPDAALPTLFWVHGGPVSHWAEAWHWRWNAGLFARHGYAVVLPNPRGSTGYGQQWVEGIWNNEWGGQCVADLLAVLDEVARDPGVDPRRVALMGASFGGWMVNRLAGTVAGIACVVSQAGIFDDRAFAGATDLPPYWHWEHGGTPWDDPGHDRWSPHRVVAGWTAPTLVIHGERDYRVPITEGLALFEALLHHGVPAELLVFPDEGHWIERPPNALAWHQHVLAFLARHLGGAAPTPPPDVPGGW